MNNLKLIVAMTMLASPVLLGGCFEDKRTAGEKVDDAATDLKEGRGVGNAAEELGNQSTGEKIGDAVEDAGQDIQRESK